MSFETAFQMNGSDQQVCFSCYGHLMVLCDRNRKIEEIG